MWNFSTRLHKWKKVRKDLKFIILPDKEFVWSDVKVVVWNERVSITFSSIFQVILKMIRAFGIWSLN